MTEIEKQVDEVIRTFDTLMKQLNRIKSGGATGTTATSSQITKAIEVLKTSVFRRIEEFETFYRDNDLDARATRVETCRLKLKKLLREHGIDLPTGTAAPSSHHHPSGAPSSAAQSSGASAAASRASGGSRGAMDMAAGGSSRMAAADANVPAPPNMDELVTLKIHLTHSEFDELRMRRQAYRELRRGEGHQAWESAYQSPRANPSAQGMYTYHEVPFKETPTRALGPEPRTMRMGRPSSPRVPLLNAGQPYSSSNPAVMARSGRAASPRDAATGGAKRVDANRPFMPATGRTSVTSALAKVGAMGSRV